MPLAKAGVVVVEFMVSGAGGVVAEAREEFDGSLNAIFGPSVSCFGTG
jgi:hypothetical protein